MENIVKARFQLHLEQLNKKYEDTKMAKRYFKRRSEILEIIISDIDKKLIPPKGGPYQEAFLNSYLENKSRKDQVTYDNQKLANIFFQESAKNAQTPPNGRRWCDSVTMLCFILRSIGSKCYDYMSSFLTVPCMQTMLNKYKTSINIWKTYLLKIEETPNICFWFRKRFKVEDNCNIDVVLGIDAISMEPLNSDEEGAHKGDNSVFLFHMLPLRLRFKPIPLHLFPFPKGNADKNIKNKINLLRKTLKELNFNVKYIATNSDTGYNIFHTELIEKWFPLFCNRGIDSAMEIFSKQDNIYVADFLHLLKNARSRILNCTISISPDGCGAFNAVDLNNALNLGVSLTDKTTHGKMKDIYPLQIFTLENFLKLIELRKFNMAFFVLPYALWVQVIRNPSMTAQMRLDFLACCLDIFSYHKLNLQHLKPGVTQSKKNGAIQYFCSEKHVNRVLNTLMALVYEIRNYSDDTALDRIGTHVLECQFGIIRLLCHYKHNWNMILKAFSKIMIINDLTDVLGVPLVIKSRENVGGVKLNGINETIYIKRPDLSMRQLYEAATALMLWEQCPTHDFMCVELIKEMNQDVLLFTNWLEDFLLEYKNQDVKIKKIWNGSAISNCTITARLISFSKSEPNYDMDLKRDEDKNKQ